MTPDRTPRRTGALALALCTLLALAACGEKPQTVAERGADDPSWRGYTGGYVVGGWKPGDKASWEEQLRQRAQNGQNEYTRVPAQR